MKNLYDFMCMTLRYMNRINILNNNNNDLRENLINDYYDKNHCINNDKCFVCNKLKDVKEDYIKVKIKRLKRVKEIIKHKGKQKTARINKMLRNNINI